MPARDASPNRTMIRGRIAGTALLALLALGAGAPALRAQEAGAELAGRLLSVEGGEWTSESFRVEAGARLTRTFRVPVRPVELPELRVEQKGECPTDPTEARRALELYENARPALRAIAELERSGRFSFVVQLVRQEFEGWSGQAGFETFRDTSIVRIPQPIASLEPEGLLRDGYARPDTTRRSYARYYAPDARALASEEFLVSHCLGVAEREEGEGLGISFSPLPGREVVDVRGILWLDAETHEPLSVDYRYTELEDFMRDYAMPILRAHYRERYRDRPMVRVRYSRIQVPDHERLGGTVEFREIRAGMRATVSWMQRVPILAHAAWSGPDIGKEVHPRAADWEHSCRVLALVPTEEAEPPSREENTSDDQGEEHRGTRGVRGHPGDDRRRVRRGGA